MSMNSITELTGLVIVGDPKNISPKSEYPNYTASQVLRTPFRTQMTELGMELGMPMGFIVEIEMLAQKKQSLH